MAFFSWGKKEETPEEVKADGTPSTDLRDRRSRFSEAVFSPLKEASGFPGSNPDAGTEFDDRLFTNIGQVSPLDLSPQRIEDAQRLSLLSYRKNPRAKRAIEIVKDFALGDQIRIRAKDPKVQKVLDDHWIENDWDNNVEDRLRDLAIFGEQLYPVAVRDGDGMVSVSHVTPLKILAVLPNPQNSIELVKVQTSVGASSVTIREQDKGKVFDIIRPTEGGRLTFDEKGDNAFYFTVNRISGATRGLPDLLPSMDWLEGLDQFVFSMLERADLAMNVVFDLMYKGLKDSEIKEKVDHFDQNMRDGLTYGHNENVELKIQAPELAGSDAEIVNRILTKHIQAGTGLAGLFYGDSDDLTRASASELSVPVARMIQSRQTLFKRVLKRILEFQIQMSADAGELQGVTDTSFVIEMPKIFLRDLKTITDSIDTLSETLIRGVERRWIDNDTAGKLFRTSLEQLGSLVEPPTQGGKAAAEEEDSTIVPGQEIDDGEEPPESEEDEGEEEGRAAAVA
ncbi:hypothetical protein LCGC14_2401840 [marine sediment metagenome]|uniref:Portal protein n=1 Tax=marine sediment metagenome TaxID=412755 RepID=A0A0F9EPK0_9ZZZZ